MAEEMKIEIIRRETLKPSSPTPNHLKHYKLSLLDQLVLPNVYPSQIFFYPNNHDFPTNQTLLLNRLKESLSKALTRFYPLAGRIRGNVFIDCRDDGAPFIEARSHGFLSTFLRNLDNDKLPEPLLPPKSELSKRLSPPLLVVQATFFACGGLAVGLYMSHKFGDGATFGIFMKDWSFLCHGGHSQTLLPALEFTASSSFPPSAAAVQPPAYESKRFAVSGEKCVTKRFVFDAAKIAALKAKAAASTRQWRRQPSRAEAITALIWRCAMSAARRTNRGFPMHFVMHQLVNFRKRIERPFSGNSIGNFVQYSSVEIDNQESKTVELSDLVAQLRKGIEGFDEGEAKRLGGDHGDAAEEIFKSWKERKDLSIRDDLKLFTCTSTLDFGFYEIDFGWGKPIWVTSDSGSSLNNFIVLTSTRDGDGVEAWVTLSEEDMAMFELDPELLSFASLSDLRVLLLPESRRGRLSKL